MNPLEALKQKLKVKPNIEKRKPVEVILQAREETEETKETNPESKLPEKEQIQKLTIIDKRNEGFDRETLMKKLAESKLLKVTVKPILKASEEVVSKAPITIPIKRAKKMTQKPKLIIEEESEEQAPEVDQAQEQGEEPPLVEEPELMVIQAPTKKERKTKKIEKGIAVLGPESVVIIKDTPLAERLPKKQPTTIVRVSDYYMNNREIFVNFINALFQPYKKELEENKENISCDSISNEESGFSLLTHQKIVRDYMNLYTPYRGLLLFHFLGTGKTCTSIAIAEGMKEAKRVIIMTPASLRTNYMEQLKKCGDLLYKKNQYWEWISDQEAFPAISAVLNLPLEYIRRKKGAWFINIKKRANYSELSSTDKKSLDEQLDEMIRNKYVFINYNGLRNKRLEELTSGYTKNLFDHSIVIIDEAHNLVSRIVNKIKKEKPIVESDRGEKEHAPKFLSTKLYEYLMSAQDARIILLTGTPVINYPNEFGILFNILRGYIKTWEITLDIKTSQKVDQTSLREMLVGVKTLDYLEYSPSSKILTITRNPFGFKNKITKRDGYQGVTKAEGEFETDDDFERHFMGILRKNDIDVVPRGIKIRNKKALPDTMELFEGNYIDSTTKELKNTDALKRRILGLSSYFRSAQESLLPKYNKVLGQDYHIVRVPMSNFQFKIYEDARVEERKMESKPKKKAANNTDELYKEPSSTYRIFSRLFCNFVMPERPMPKLEFSKEKEEKREEKGLESLLKQANKREEALDVTNDQEGEVEGDEILDELGGETYKKRLEEAIQNIEEHSNDFLTPEALQTYSPKFLHILENIQDPEHVGLNLVYSQFRTLEGVGIFSLVLKKNGFAQFKIKKNTVGQWTMDIPEVDLGKPAFALYSGTETAEEKEIIRNIYNGDWNYLPTNIASELKKRANNNNLGEIIKVLMITSSGSEGINLRNTRYVHIMEPYWHPVRSEQVIGRARRICSHKDLPKNLQTVEVFVYLMEFTPEQLKSDASIELKRKDISKSVPHVPITSDQYLYEISEMKLNLTNQLTDVIKQSSFDCSIYGNGKCVSFAEPTKTQFSYVPDYSQQQSDITVRSNIKKIEWVGKSITINGVEYVYRRISPKVLNIYDKNSYLEAMQNPGINPIQIGTYEVNERGQQIFRSTF